MQIKGQIFPASSEKEFSRKAWCRYIKSRPEFSQRPRDPVPNPFKPGTMMQTPFYEDMAGVVVNGSNVGSVWWSMNEELLVNVDVEESALPLVHQWAAELGGEFRQQEW